jgi:hypothetical protein
MKPTPEQWSERRIMAYRNRLSITRVTPAYWRVALNNPPLKLFDPEMFAEFNVLMDDLERAKDVKIIVPPATKSGSSPRSPASTPARPKISSRRSRSNPRSAKPGSSIIRSAC